MVSQLHTADPDILKYAFSIGLIPGSLCWVLKRAPLEGPVTVNLGEETVAVSYALSEIVEVQEVRVSFAGEG
jgi:Fe2+ transport system protein FeoA